MDLRLHLCTGVRKPEPVRFAERRAPLHLCTGVRKPEPLRFAERWAPLHL